MIIVPDDPGEAAVDEVLQATVIKVFDGDGFLARVWNPHREAWVDRVPFRFAFIDAPEMEQPYGPESRQFLCDLIQDKSLRLDPVGKESAGYAPIDQYKRMLCMAFLTEQISVGEVIYFRNGEIASGLIRNARPVIRNVELEMVVNGWAWVTEQFAFEREAEYFGAQEVARDLRRGLWASNNPEPPWNFKRRLKRRSAANQNQQRLL